MTVSLNQASDLQDKERHVLVHCVPKN